jgi:hypothetical protein
MARTSRNDDELREASDHLYYEIQMLRSTMALLATGAFGESILSNALIESFTIHARALMHFLYPPEHAQSSDVLAEDFFDDAGRWMAIRPEEPAVFGTARGRVNKEIAHLTYDRQLVTPELKGWDFVALGNAILKIVQVFLSAIPKRLLGSRWQQIGAECGSYTSIAPLQVAGEYRTDVSTPGNV